MKYFISGIRYYKGVLHPFNYEVEREKTISDYDDILAIERDLAKHSFESFDITILYWRKFEDDN